MKNNRTLHTLWLLCFTTTLLLACTKEETIENEQQETSARITDIVSYDDLNMTAINFTYLSTDPWGEPVTLSATVTYSNDITTHDSAEGILLYNHFTIYRADQCPSKGGVSEQGMIAGSKLITISPDYYGFGITEESPQAYCISQANAQAAIDALIEGRKLMANRGFKWKNNLFNAGYSQGGQTAMAVVKLATQRYPEIRFTRTFAGGGSYDLATTYRRFVIIDRSAMPSTVASTMLSFNHFKQLGIPRDSLFVEPLLSHVDEWILSKRYTRQEIDDLVGSEDINTYVSPVMLDTTSQWSLLMMNALQSDNICTGWTPRSNENIFLLHHSLDGAVPVENTINLAAFLQQQGATNTEVVIEDFGSMFGQPYHETGALYFIMAAKEWLCQYLGIDNW